MKITLKYRPSYSKDYPIVCEAFDEDGTYLYMSLGKTMGEARKDIEEKILVKEIIKEEEVETTELLKQFMDQNKGETDG